MLLSSGTAVGLHCSFPLDDPIAIATYFQSMMELFKDLDYKRTFFTYRFMYKFSKKSLDKIFR